jgi:NAD(P)-dependent dehydrogenase (short-subunit alcohol dehydrogenase family)
MKFSGKIALITGGNDGIGKATAHRFVNEGAKVVLMARREDKGKEVVRELAAIHGDADCALFVKGDVNSEEDAANAVNRAIEKYGRLDILVNCAAVQGAGTVLDATPEDYARFFNINIRGYGLCAKAAIPYLLKSEGSAIVNVGSLVGCVGTANRMLYDISKAAVIHMTKCLACDYPTIRVNCVSPGFTASEAMLEGLGRSGTGSKEIFARLSSMALLNRMATPDEQANVIFFLASDEASYMTGENIIVDGGISCKM